MRLGNVKRRLRFAAGRGKAAGMEKKPDTLSREERLAAKLRENLKRRKMQARAHDSQGLGSNPAQDDNAPLSKTPPKS